MDRAGNKQNLEECRSHRIGAGRPGVRQARRIVHRSFRDSRRRGAVLIWVAIIGMALIGMIGLAMDAGVVMLAGNQLQTAADAAALAGAWRVKESAGAARLEAFKIAYKNKAAGLPVKLRDNPGNGETGDIVVGVYTRFPSETCESPPCFEATTTNPNAVRIRARRTDTSLTGKVPLVFGSAPGFGVNGVNVARTATAMLVGGTGSGIVILQDNALIACALWLLGNTSLVVENADGYEGAAPIYVNSDHDRAVCLQYMTSTASPELIAPEINITGDIDIDEGVTLDAVVNHGTSPVEDPLADLPSPSTTSAPNLGKITSSGVYGPGYYPGGIALTGDAEVNLQPGVYILEGPGLHVKDQARLTANGVMIYVRQGNVDMTTTGAVRITSMPMTGGNPFGGVSIYQARGNARESKIFATDGQLFLEGTLYFPSAQLILRGSSDHLGSQLVAWRTSVEQPGGQGQFTINYDGRFPVRNYAVFLVE